MIRFIKKKRKKRVRDIGCLGRKRRGSCTLPLGCFSFLFGKPDPYATEKSGRLFPALSVLRPCSPCTIKITFKKWNAIFPAEQRSGANWDGGGRGGTGRGWSCLDNELRRKTRGHFFAIVLGHKKDSFLRKENALWKIRRQHTFDDGLIEVCPLRATGSRKSSSQWYSISRSCSSALGFNELFFTTRYMSRHAT